MSDEVKVTEGKECKCLCNNKEFKKFLVIALGTFVGAYAALSLFAALHRPPAMMPCPCGFGRPAPIAAPCPYGFQKHNFNKDFRGEKGKFHKGGFEQKAPAPFENNRENDKD